MGKVKTLIELAEELKVIGETLVGISGDLEKLFGGTLDTEQPEKSSKPIELDIKPEEESKPTVTIEDVRSVLAEKLRAGHGAEVKALIAKHGADTLSAVTPSEYAALLKEAEVIV